MESAPYLLNNIVLTVAYDGTPFYGWQKTKMGASIESVLQDVIEQIYQHPVRLQAASRTDRGVHAKGQVVNFFSQKALDLDQLKKSLNALLPGEISILEINRAKPTFHPTINASGKEYNYFLCNSDHQLPWNKYYSWHFYYPIDLSLMKAASKYLLGTHDFAAFCNVKKNETYENTIRSISSIEIDAFEEKRLKFSITGDSFLYKMVRNIVGTLAYIGCGKLNIEDLPELLQNGDREAIGMTAPSCGLFLNKVFYNIGSI